MNKKELNTRIVANFIGLAVAGISIAASAQIVPDGLAQTIMVAFGSAVFGAGLTFFLLKISK